MGYNSPRGVLPTKPTLVLPSAASLLMTSAEDRRTIPFSAAEKALQKVPYIYTSGTIPVKEKDAEYVFYQTWSDGRVEQKNVDLLWVHGLNDYGGRISECLDTWLSAGIRVVALDLPAHGRSGGQVVSEVITFITENDNPSHPKLKSQRKVFVGGGSLGGWVSLEYGLKPTENTAGIISWSPMIYTVGESTPNIFVQYIAHFLIRIGLGWIPLAPANRGKGSTPENEAKFMNDPQAYHGNLRVATGLQLLGGMYHIRENMDRFKQPVLLIHGKKDRVTEWRSSDAFYASCESSDKELILYDHLQHDLMREPDADVVLVKTRDWILERLD